ncbi:hypothetical protein G9A89_009581 [Geosiphon pyriformis]|nr:hypothetical protein G9A89_009581 [Geosiphon pyriformis]
MEITNDIHVLAQQLFQLIQQQNMKITINQQTIQYQDTRKIPKYKKLDSIMVNQMRKITNAQFEELQNRITQVILEKEVQKILKKRELELGDLENLNGAQY